MQWGVNQHHRRPLGAESVGGLLAAVSRTVVHNPEDATGRAIGRLAHHLGDQAIHGPDSVFGLAAPKQLGSVDIPGREIGPGTGAVVFMLDLHRATGRRSQRGVLTATSLDAGFLVGADNELGGPQGPTVPASLGVQVENATCFLGELRVAGKDPTAMSPRAEGVGAEPPPQGAAADFAYDALRDNLALDFGEGQPGQRQSQSIGKFTSESFDLNDDAGGKSGRGARPEVRLPDPGAAPGRIACATC